MAAGDANVTLYVQYVWLVGIFGSFELVPWCCDIFFGDDVLTTTCVLVFQFPLFVIGEGDVAA